MRLTTLHLKLQKRKGKQKKKQISKGLTRFFNFPTYFRLFSRHLNAIKNFCIK